MKNFEKYISTAYISLYKANDWRIIPVDNTWIINAKLWFNFVLWHVNTKAALCRFALVFAGILHQKLMNLTNNQTYYKHSITCYFSVLEENYNIKLKNSNVTAKHITSDSKVLSHRTTLLLVTIAKFRKKGQL